MSTNMRGLLSEGMMYWVPPRAHILPLRRRGHATLHDQNSKRVNKNSNKWVMIVTCIHTYVREYSKPITKYSLRLNFDEYSELYGSCMPSSP